VVPKVGRCLAKAGAATLDHLRIPKRGVVILAYHRVGGSSGLELDLDADVFSRQIASLQTQHVVTLDEGLDALSVDRQPTADDPIVVTFDDGTADFADVAFPILAACHIPVTVYAATRFIEERTAFRGSGQPISWAALQDCVSTGLVTIGSHTHSHALLDRLPPAQVPGELDRSVDLVRERLGVDPGHFAYPRSLNGSAAAQEAVRQRFRSAALGGMRANPYGATDPHHLMRSPIQASDGMRWFNHKLAGGMAAEDDLRRFLNHWRYSGATT
jgi:peptidoglycan/xylan/chitin deacetylase (PgdA/CDA1 family)